MKIEAYCFAVNEVDGHTVLDEGWFVDFVGDNVHGSPQDYILFRGDVAREEEKSKYYIYPRKSVYFKVIGK